MSEPQDNITWLHDCPPGHELRSRVVDLLDESGQPTGEKSIEVTCIELSDEPVPPMSGQTVKWCGVHQVVVDWEWTGSAFVVPQVEVSFVAEDDPDPEPNP